MVKREAVWRKSCREKVLGSDCMKESQMDKTVKL